MEWELPNPMFTTNATFNEHVRALFQAEAQRLEGQALIFIRMGYQPLELTVLVRKIGVEMKADVVPMSVMLPHV